MTVNCYCITHLAVKKNGLQDYNLKTEKQESNQRKKKINFCGSPTMGGKNNCNRNAFCYSTKVTSTMSEPPLFLVFKGYKDCSWQIGHLTVNISVFIKLDQNSEQSEVLPLSPANWNYFWDFLCFQSWKFYLEHDCLWS